MMMYGQSSDVPDDDDWLVPIGKANIVRSGTDITITAFSIMVGRALQAADMLAEHGIVQKSLIYGQFAHLIVKPL